MKLRIAVVPLIILIFPALFPSKEVAPPRLKDSSSVSSILFKLGDDPGWYPDLSVSNSSAEKGEELFHTGFSSKSNGRKTTKQSKHFNCTSCHNVVREDPDLLISDPQARLDYVDEKGIPFLQGTTLYGAVSRRTFYNDDYELKYGDLVKPARHDLRGAIQLCAVECAQGRELDNWELESILKYLWKIDLKIKDLDLTNIEKAEIEEMIQNDQVQAIEMIKSKYLSSSPATFANPNKERSYYNTKLADVANGEKIFRTSCMHCHENGRYSYFSLDTTQITMKHLQRKATTYKDHSIYQAVRYGIYSTNGRRSYMPQYPLEKMSEKQLADLRGYIDYVANGGE